MRQVLPASGHALEIASGTGQHAVAFAGAFPALTWQPTDIAPAHLVSIDAWRAHVGAENLRVAQYLDAGAPDWPADWARAAFDVVTVGNLFHLVSESLAANVVAGAARALRPGGQFLVYGPFREHGRFRSEGDAAFHARLSAEDPETGYKSVEWLTETAAAAGLTRRDRVEMPANNLFLVFGAG